MDEGGAPRESGAPHESGVPHESGAAPPAPPHPPAPAASGSAARRITWVLVAAAALFGAAYFLGGLRPAGPETGEEAAALGGDDEDASHPAPLDTLITPADLPGFETEQLTNAQRLWLYHRAHREQCACGCDMTVAQCRVEDPTCPESPGRAVELVQEAREAVPGGG